MHNKIATKQFVGFSNVLPAVISRFKVIVLVVLMLLFKAYATSANPSAWLQLWNDARSKFPESVAHTTACQASHHSGHNVTTWQMDMDRKAHRSDFGPFRHVCSIVAGKLKAVGSNTTNVDG